MFDGSVSSDNQDERRPYDGAFALVDPVMKSVSGDSETLKPQEIRAIAEWSWALRWGGMGVDPGYRAVKLAEITQSRQLVPLLLHALYQAGDSASKNTEALTRVLAKLTGLELPSAAAYYDACAPVYGLPEGAPP
jgi:hypothetical protein